ncbi:MAG: hypothetical protein ACREJC_15440 [Tepidisphaeraceae bacterium]
MIRAIQIFGITLLVFVGSSPARAADPFEGNSWKVSVVPDEDSRGQGGKDFDDLLVFKGGKLTSTECQKRGFAPAEYQEDTRRGPVAKFSAEMSSDKEGTCAWSGMVTGADISGVMTWTKKDGTIVRYTFKGERVRR